MTGERPALCPRCGGAAVHYNFAQGIHEIMCADDECQLSNPFNYRTKEDAIAAWNTRSLPAALDVVLKVLDGHRKVLAFRHWDTGEWVSCDPRSVAYALRALRAGEGEDERR